MRYRENPILDKSYLFSLEIIKLTEILEKEKKFIIARQILRSGTSIGANIREAQGAESRPDFQHKLKIAYKEALETEYWLNLINDSAGYPTTKKHLAHLTEILKLLSTIISTSKKKSLAH